MSKVKFVYEILVSGIYPFEGKLEKCGFEIVKRTIDEKIFNNLLKESVIYFNPLIGRCCYPDSTGDVIYLTFVKEESIEIDYGNYKVYDVKVTNNKIRELNLFRNVDMLEKTLVLEINNDIKFPIKRVTAYDENGNFITVYTESMDMNVPSLISSNQTYSLEVIGRQNNRINSGIAYDKIIELADNNKFFKNALTMYHSSFAVSNVNVGFTLLVIALESLLGLATYKKVEKCPCCSQQKFLITSTISKNVSIILMDHDAIIEKEMKEFYKMRSGFVHSGVGIDAENEQKLQEYVRKVLLMYWYVSMYKETYEHKTIINEIQNEEYGKNIMYQTFLNGLENMPFSERRETMLKNILQSILENNKKQD